MPKFATKLYVKFYTLCKTVFCLTIEKTTLGYYFYTNSGRDGVANIRFESSAISSLQCIVSLRNISSLSNHFRLYPIYSAIDLSCQSRNRAQFVGWGATVNKSDWKWWTNQVRRNVQIRLRINLREVHLLFMKM